MPNDLRNLRRRAARARDFPANTCGASRHVQGMAEQWLRGSRVVILSPEEAGMIAESMLATVEVLWKARTELAKLRRGK